jgi:CBS domain-containing protein
MTPDVVSVPQDLPIAAAIDVMAQRGFKRVPVLDHAGRLVGLVSRADILQTVAQVVPQAAPQRTPSGRVQQVADVMQRDVPTVRFDTPLSTVVDALAEGEQRRVVVVDAQDHVLGIITDGDVIRRASAEERPGVVRRMVKRLRGSAAPTARHLLVSGRVAADVMTTPVVTIAADATPSAAIRLMQAHRVKRLPVLDANGRVVGLIGRAGVLQALSEAT